MNNIIKEEFEMTFNEFVNLFNGKATDFDKGSGVK